MKKLLRCESDADMIGCMGKKVPEIESDRQVCTTLSAQEFKRLQHYCVDVDMTVRDAARFALAEYLGKREQANA